LKGLVSNFAAHPALEAARKLEVMTEKSEFSGADDEALAALEENAIGWKTPLRKMFPAFVGAW